MAISEHHQVVKSEMEDTVEIVLLKFLWGFVFLCALTFNVFTKFARFLGVPDVGSAPKISVEAEKHILSKWLQNKYNITAYFYDFCDMPWERIYRKLRPKFVGDLTGECLELGVGTGRNLRFYGDKATVTGVDISAQMIRQAKARAALPEVACKVKEFIIADATNLAGIPDNAYDNVSASFLFCVLPNELQQPALEQIHRVLKPGGTFRLIELLYATNPKVRWYQDTFAPFVEFMYGARFDRHTVEALKKVPGLTLTKTEYMNDAKTMLMVEGVKAK